MYRTYARKGWEIVGWTYHADIYCKTCGDWFPAIDPEGNTKHPIFATDEIGQPDPETGEWSPEYCGNCGLESGEW